MNENRRPSSEQTLADRLRQEARQSRPEFSEELHTRICRAVEDARGRPLPLEMATGRPPARWLLAAAIAACVLLAVAAVWQMQDSTSWLKRRAPAVVQHSSPNSSGTSVVSTPTSVKSDPAVASSSDEDLEAIADLAVLVTDGVVRSSLVNRRWGYLDDDFRLAVEFINDRFPWSDTATATSKN